MSREKYYKLYCLYPLENSRQKIFDTKCEAYYYLLVIYKHLENNTYSTWKQNFIYGLRRANLTTKLFMKFWSQHNNLFEKDTVLYLFKKIFLFKIENDAIPHIYKEHVQRIKATQNTESQQKKSTIRKACKGIICIYCSVVDIFSVLNNNSKKKTQ